MLRSVILAALILLGQAEASKEIVRQISRFCIKKTNAPEEAVTLFRTNRLELEESEKCYVQCVMEEFGIIKNEKINPFMAKKLAEERFGQSHYLETAIKAVNICLDVMVHPQQKCSLGVAFRDCLIKNKKSTKGSMG